MIFERKLASFNIAPRKTSQLLLLLLGKTNTTLAGEIQCRASALGSHGAERGVL